MPRTVSRPKQTTRREYTAARVTCADQRSCHEDKQENMDVCEGQARGSKRHNIERGRLTEPEHDIEPCKVILPIYKVAGRNSPRAGPQRGPTTTSTQALGLGLRASSCPSHAERRPRKVAQAAAPATTRSCQGRTGIPRVESRNRCSAAAAHHRPGRQEGNCQQTQPARVQRCHPLAPRLKWPSPGGCTAPQLSIRREQIYLARKSIRPLQHEKNDDGAHAKHEQ